jgi:ATP-dependent DNA helicase RecG
LWRSWGGCKKKFIIAQFPTITVKELAKMLSVTERTIYRNLDELKSANKIERVGSDKTGFWKVRFSK